MKARLFVVLLFLGGAFLCAQDTPVERESLLIPGPGVFAENQIVEIHGYEGNVYQYRFSESVEQGWVDYRVPLELTALPGEERVFNLEVRERKAGDPGEILSFRYTIDKRRPQAPTVSTMYENNSYFLRFSVEDDDDTVEYWIDSFRRNEFRSWTGGRVPLEKGSLVKAYSVDEAGNHSEVVTNQVTSGLGSSDIKKIDLLSPVEGEFQNPQILAIAGAESFEWIRYSLDGSDPERYGHQYNQPVLIERRGDIRLRIAAKKPFDDEVLKSQLLYSIAEKPVTPIEVAGGDLLTHLQNLPSPDPPAGYRIYFSLKDRDVTRRDPPLTAAIPCSITEGMVNYVPYRIGLYDEDGQEMLQYRSFYIVDRRYPAPPIIESEGKLPFQSRETVSIKVPKGAEVYYTTDGSTPDEYADIYRGPFTVRPSGTADIGSVGIQAVARFPNGNVSEVTRMLLPFDREAPVPPTYSILSRTQNEVVFELNHPEEGIDFVYALAYDRNYSLKLNEKSPCCGQRLRVAFPYGYSGNAMIRFGAKDEAGNISQPTATEEIRIDTVPPNPPEINVRDLIVDIKGEGTLYYRIFPGDTDYRPFTGTVRLSTEEGRKLNYRINAVAEDPNGNRSAPAVSQVVYDRREAKLPRISGVADNAHYNAPVTVQSVEEYSDSVSYYTLVASEKKQGEERGQALIPAEPGLTDHVLSGALSLSGEEKKEIEYHLKVRSYLPGSESWSGTAEYRFVIDRLAPEPKDIQHLIQPGLFNSSLFIREPGLSDGEELWLHIAERRLKKEEITAESIRNKRISAASGVTVEGKPGEEVTYFIYTAVYDQAGNSSVSGPYTVTIDRKKPEAPRLRGVPDKRFTRSTVIIYPPDEYDDDIVYEMTEDDSVPRIPDEKSKMMETSIRLQGADKGEKSYYILFRGVDAAGNFSEIGTIHITILETETKEPAPVVSRVGQRVWEITFLSRETEQVYYSISGGDFIKYTTPVLYEMPPGTDSFTLDAYSRDQAGGQSSVISRRFNVQDLSVSVVRGVVDGILYDNTVRIVPQVRGEDIRYELASDLDFFPSLTVESPRLSKPLHINAQDGRENTYRLTVGIYEQGAGSFHSIETYEFEIDRASPLPPELTGIEDGIHYTDDRTVRIETGEEGTIAYYRIRESDGPETPTIRYTKPEKIQVREGVRKDFTMEMWNVDQAGNRSATEVVSFVIDKAGIYVSLDGRDRATGGKDSPFRTLDRALYEAVHTNRNTIYLSQGEYTVSESMIIDKQLSIRGGYSREDWSSNPDYRTFIDVDERFPHNRAMIELEDGTLRLDTLVLSNSRMGNPLILQKGEFSNLIIRDSLLLHDSSENPVLINSSAGNLMISDTGIEISALKEGRIFQLKGSSFVFKNSSITGSDGSGILSLFDLDSCEAEFVSAYLHIGRVSRSVTIEANDSDISIIDSDIGNGAGSVKSTIIEQNRGNLTIRDSVIGRHEGADTAPARIAAGIEANSARVAIDDSVLNCRGINGVIQLNARSSSVTVKGSRIENNAVSEFSYLLRINGGSCTLSQVDMRAESSYDMYGIDADGRAVVLVSASKMELGAAENTAVGLVMDTEGIGTVQDSSLICRGGPKTVAVEQAGSGINRRGETPSPNIKLIENLFSGWDYLLINDDKQIRTIEDLESEKPPFDVKNPHTGNREE